jgi:aspartyl protease family protein
MKPARRQQPLRALAPLALLVLSLSVQAVTDIHVVALFKDRVMVEIDGKRHLLRSGETSPEGVTLVSADSAGAVFTYAGKTLERRLDGRARAPAQSGGAAAGEEVRIYRDNRGMFKTVGSINGLPVDFLVDTGASSVAMNSAAARRLGIDYRVEGESTWVATASNVTQAFSVTLARVKVGDIELRNVEAVVIDGPRPSDVLLGMTFLQRLDMHNQGDHLTLRKKF